MREAGRGGCDAVPDRAPCIVSAIGGGRHVRLRISQLRAATDPSFRSRYARRLVETKLHHQASFMRDAAERRPDLGYEMRRAADRLNNAARQVGRLEADGPGALMGTEGAAAAQFFLAYRLLFAKSLGFTGRNRRPPRDPVNATLSLGYTLLHVEAIKAVSGCGLDSGIGFLHEPEQGRESLACDLVETERALVDGLVWNLFRERQLRPEHFRITDGGCLMAKAARRAFYEAVEPVLTKARGRLRRRCAFLVRLLGSRAE